MSDKKLELLINEVEDDIKDELKYIDSLAYLNSKKVIDTFKECNVSEIHFSSTTGYGYGDIGREKIEEVFSMILGGEDSLVRNQFISGSHALTVTLFALLRPGDTLLSITGKPYDTLDEVIGIRENPSSLKSFGVSYLEVDLIDDDFDYKKIKEVLTKNKIKVIEIQRSKGYSTRKSIGLEPIDKVIKYIREIDPELIIMIDNCYCEFTEEKSPLEIDNPADIIVGSLIKNLGGGIAPNGAYVTGKRDLIDLVADRLTVPGEGRDVGPTLGINKNILLGLYMAPNAVASSLKTAIFTSRLLEKLGYKVEPLYNEKRCDIVQNIIFNDEEKIIKYVQGIQGASAIDANVAPIPGDMPGYEDQVIMASGSFTQGSSIEISCDGPLRKPYIAFQQGGLTYEYGKIAVINAVKNLFK